MPRWDLESIRTAWPIERVLEAHGIATENSRRIPCPLCNQNQNSVHPSFAYRTDFFYCFRCEVKGDCFTLFMKLDGGSFTDIIRKIGGGHRKVFPLVRQRNRPDWQDLAEEREVWAIHDRFIHEQLQASLKHIAMRAKLNLIPVEDTPFYCDLAREGALRDWELLDETRTMHLFGLKAEIEAVHQAIKHGADSAGTASVDDTSGG
jgi:hypothetical protein